MKQTVKRKNYYLDEAKIKGAQKILETRTETETIDRALTWSCFAKRFWIHSKKPGRGRESILNEETPSRY